MTYFGNMADINWNNWLNKDVSWDMGENIPRRTAIYRLCKIGLIPFIESHGYMMKSSLKQLGSNIATGLFINREKSHIESNWNFGYTEDLNITAENKNRYYHVIDTYDWAKFWEIWGLWCDIDVNMFRGLDRQIDIQEYMSTQIWYERSPQTRIVNEFLGFENGENISEHEGRDIYLKESSDSNEWGGYRR